MFMTTAPTRTGLANGPHPVPDRPEFLPAPSRSAGLLNLVQTIITFGKGLLQTLQGPIDPQTWRGIPVRFSTDNIALIIVRITRGLLMAEALHDRLARIARQLDRPSAPRAAAATASPAQTRLPRTPAIQPYWDDTVLPTKQEIAALIRNRPIGRVLEDIALDLGILPSDKLWQRLNLPIISNGGDVVRLLKRTTRQAFSGNHVWLRELPVPESLAPPLRVATGPS
ncbi:MAG TPA: hypothetical protein DDZ81_25215 [Acetobacteraceae bacterium]|nr:hypothetical protein [Acetobacteraceae bacterium]